MQNAFMICCSFAIITSFVSILSPQRKLIGLYLFTVSIFPFLWIWNSHGYEHYSIICLPLFVLSVIEIRAIWIEEIPWKRFFLKSILAVFFVLIIGLASYRRYDNGQWGYSDCRQDISFFSDIIKNIPADERNSFVSYMIPPSIYLYNEIKPCYPYFCLQSWYSFNGPSMGTRIDSVFSTCKAKWILSKETKVREKVQEVLDTHYKIYLKDEYKGMTYILYRKDI